MDITMHYAIGDIQGCFDSLLQLLDLIQFNDSLDTLWFTGDLVNRGPKSLETLRFIKKLGPKHRIVLGNHDLHLLALLHDCHKGWPDDTLDAILKADDRMELMHWLLQQPLFHHDSNLGFSMVHAGLDPTWDLAMAAKLGQEVEAVLQGDNPKFFFQELYGNQPDLWDDKLTGFSRLRCIVNYFTRVRLCFPNGRLSFDDNDKNIMPWFEHPHRKTKNNKIIFGHWAALSGVTNTPNTYALDTGCVWGYALTAMRLEDEKRFSVGCN
jgi:bis(5'-nucleosyl)-tetraphosphatase (symmetrical)